jgi:tetratricopeptide (TPR) repeat protein
VAALARPAAADDANKDSNFWEQLITPNKKEVELILRHVTELQTTATQYGYGYGYGGTVDYGIDNHTSEEQRNQRLRRLEDAFGMLRYARRELDPSHPKVLYELGRAADEIERYDDALDALAAFLEVADASRDSYRIGEAHLRIGRIHARYGDWDEAIDSFREALVRPSGTLQTTVMLFLGGAYMQADRLDDAIDILSQAASGSPYAAYTGSQAPLFALAVAYDRDEQITRSHEVLEKVRVMDPNFSYVLGYPDYNFSTEPLMVPPHELHYFRGLRFEATGMLDEARVEWLAYARAEDEGSRFRSRALEHVEAIDELQDDRAKETETKSTTTVTPTVFYPP